MKKPIKYTGIGFVVLILLTASYLLFVKTKTLPAGCWELYHGYYDLFVLNSNGKGTTYTASYGFNKSYRFEGFIECEIDKDVLKIYSIGDRGYRVNFDRRDSECKYPVPLFEMKIDKQFKEDVIAISDLKVWSDRNRQQKDDSRGSDIQKIERKYLQLPSPRTEGLDFNYKKYIK